MLTSSDSLTKKLLSKTAVPVNKRDFLSYLENKNAIAKAGYPKPGSTIEDYEYEIKKSPQELDDLIETYVLEKQVEIIVTTNKKNIPLGWHRTSETIKSLFRESEPNSQIIIVMPIVDPDQAVSLFGEIKQAIKKKTQVKMITLPADMVFPDKKNKQKKAIQEMKNLGVSIKLVRNWGFLHAKIICFGKNIAYIGSANWTPGGFKKNFELGILLRGKKVKALVDFIQELI